MSFALLVLSANLLLVVFGRFSGLRANDYEKNWMRKVNESILPTEVLHRSRELEYIRYVTEQNVKSKGNNMLLQKMKPDIMQRNKIEPLIFNTDPDEQAAYLTIIEWEKNEDNNNNQKSESMLEKIVASPTAESQIQILEHVTTTKDNLLNDGGLKKDLELQPNMNGTLEQNIAEVYEEPFIRVYVKPLCGGPDC